MTSEERRALALLANDPNGVTEAMLVAHGFAVSMLARLVVDGLVIAKHEAGDRKMDVTESREASNHGAERNSRAWPEPRLPLGDGYRGAKGRRGHARGCRWQPHALRTFNRFRPSRL